jgi:hypothetical protein
VCGKRKATAVTKTSQMLGENSMKMFFLVIAWMTAKNDSTARFATYQVSFQKVFWT